MKIETTLGTVILVGLGTFFVGAQVGYYKTKAKEKQKVDVEELKEFLKDMAGTKES